VSLPDDEQLGWLEDFLLQHMEADQCLPLDAAHGYLTAVVSGPRMIMPSEWLPRVLGKVEFADMEETSRITETLMGLYNGIIEELEEGSYEPIVLTLEENRSGRPQPLPYGWCEGYLVGWKTHGEQVLDTMLEDEEAAGLLAPVVAFLMYEEDQLMDPPDPEGHRQTAMELGPSAVGLYRWWLPRREMPVGNA